jgi:hypothetical protein
MIVMLVVVSDLRVLKKFNMLFLVFGGQLLGQYYSAGFDVCGIENPSHQ